MPSQRRTRQTEEACSPVAEERTDPGQRRVAESRARRAFARSVIFGPRVAQMVRRRSRRRVRHSSGQSSVRRAPGSHHWSHLWSPEPPVDLDLGPLPYARPHPTERPCWSCPLSRGRGDSVGCVESCSKMRVTCGSAQDVLVRHPQDGDAPAERTLPDGHPSSQRTSALGAVASPACPGVRRRDRSAAEVRPLSLGRGALARPEDPVG